MKVVQINATCGSGSTGKICVEISKLLTRQQTENYICYASGNSDYPLGRKYMNPQEIKIAALKSRVFGNWGFNSSAATRRLINELEAIKPDIVHLHNMHGHNCNLKLLLNYLKDTKIKVVWTFHDCWLFTGYCMYYDMSGCEKWKNGCGSCPQYKEYSWLFDKSGKLCSRKKELLSNLDLTVVTPSEWLAEQIKESFLKENYIKVINNGIDLSVFKPTNGDFKEKHGLNGKFIVLGIAFDWEARKGLDVFVELSKQLPENYQIVLVGTNASVDKALPDNIISIHRTQNQNELAQIYSAADVFVNPTREENYPTVNMESLACGTPVVTFKTGGSAEIIDETCGVSVITNDFDSLKNEVIRVCETKAYSKEACIERAKSFDMYERFQEYIDLYEEVLK